MSSLPTIGFAILSYEGDDRLLRLVRTLGREYNDPAIVVHHDFGQASIDTSAFPANVAFVEKWEAMGWAKWSVVAGTLKAFRQLIDESDAEWFFLVSAADYPIRGGDEVRAELAALGCDALIDFRPCIEGRRPRARTIGETNPVMSFMDTSANHALKRRFTMSPQFWIPIIRRKPRWRIGRITWRPPIKGRHPFTAERAAFYGDHWWGGNRKAIEAVLEPGGFAERLRRHFRMRTHADESYYCSVLAARADLTLCLNHRRWAEWTGGGARPQMLTNAELGQMLASGAYFARKFAPNDTVRDAIDAHLRSGRQGTS